MDESLISIQENYNFILYELGAHGTSSNNANKMIVASCIVAERKSVSECQSLSADRGTERDHTFADKRKGAKKWPQQ